MRRLWRAVARGFRAYAAWYDALPPEVHAQIIRDQQRLL
jgi:hypothetical protein